MNTEQTSKNVFTYKLRNMWTAMLKILALFLLQACTFKYNRVKDKKKLKPHE